MCGEQSRATSSTMTKIGSPPRVRGTDGPDRLADQGERITPACAGNRMTIWREGGGSLDHPRVCGEQWSAQGSLIGGWGSPPRVRGTAFLVMVKKCVLRITPACAGNSGTLALLENFLQDHPRVCGEQALTTIVAESLQGSPPRVRGTDIA